MNVYIIEDDEWNIQGFVWGGSFEEALGAFMRWDVGPWGKVELDVRDGYAYIRGAYRDGWLIRCRELVEGEFIN